MCWKYRKAIFNHFHSQNISGPNCHYQLLPRHALPKQHNKADCWRQSHGVAPNSGTGPTKDREAWQNTWPSFETYPGYLDGWSCCYKYPIQRFLLQKYFEFSNKKQGMLSPRSSSTLEGTTESSCLQALDCGFWCPWTCWHSSHSHSRGIIYYVADHVVVRLPTLTLQNQECYVWQEEGKSVCDGGAGNWLHLYADVSGVPFHFGSLKQRLPLQPPAFVRHSLRPT